MTLCLWAAASCAGNPTVEVEEAWVAEGPPTATALAGYLTLHNRGDNTVVLKGVGSPLFASAAPHRRTVITQGVASMVAQPSVELGGGASLRFMPGDYHIMLMHPSQPLKVGDQVPITRDLADGSTLDVSTVVRRWEGSGHDHHHHAE